MKDIPDNLIAEKNRLHSEYPWVDLFEVTLVDTTVKRYCNYPEDIVYDNNTYEKCIVQLGLIESTVDGEIPNVMLKLCNITRPLADELEAQDGGIEAAVKLTSVNIEYLEEDYSWSELDFTVIGCSVDALWIEWTLGMPNPLNKWFPLDRYLADHCAWVFTGGVAVEENVECGYIGAYTTCNRTFNNCIIRENTANWGGNLGMQSEVVKIA